MVSEWVAILDALYDCSNLTTIYCPSEKPVGGKDIDTDGCTVYVPHGCVEVYKSYPSWSLFKNIQEYDFSSREVIYPDNTKPIVRVDGRSILVEGDTRFTVSDNMGRISPQENLSAGVYVVKPDNGDAVKVVIR